MTRTFTLVCLIALAGCNGETVQLTNPFTGATATIDPTGFAEQRARVELEVKSNFDAILRDIAAGGGPALASAFDTALVPEAERPSRIPQLQEGLGVFQNNPDALINALLRFSS